MRPHGSPNGRSSWDPMLAELAIIGNTKDADYETVCGRASVDALSGTNYFKKSVDGLHEYVVRIKPPQYYADRIDDKIK